MLTGIALPIDFGPFTPAPSPRTAADQAAHTKAYASLLAHGVGCSQCTASEECTEAAELFAELRRYS